MRFKDDAHVYRYFPDPYLLTLDITVDFINNISSSLPKLPDEIREELKAKYGLSSYDAAVITEEKDIADYFFKAAEGRDGKLISNWLTSELFGMLNKNGLSIIQSPIKPEDLGELVDLISDGTISGRIAKDIFPEIFKTRKSASEIINERGLKQTSDKDEINSIIDGVLMQNKDKVNEFKNGKEKLFGFFVGQVMKQSQGKANPKIVNELLKKKLSD